MYLGIGLGITRLSGVLGFNPASLFANGEEGAWYDPSDLSTLYQTATGTTPVTAAGQPVGLMLDKSKGGLSATELVDAFTLGTGWTYAGGVLSCDGSTSNQSATETTNATSGQYYLVTFDVNHVSGLMQVRTGDTFVATIGSSGVRTYIIKAAAASSIIRFTATTPAFTGTIDNISVRELPGNHATQSSSAKRPILQSSGGLYYLDFDGADDWMRTTFGAAQAQPNTIAAALKFDQGSRNEFVVDGVSTDRNAIYKTTTDLQLFAGSSITDPSAAGTTELVALGHLNTTSSELRVDGSQVVTGDVGSNQWGGVTLGADSSDTLWLDGRIYGFVGVNRTLTAGEIDDVESYLAAKSGVTL